MKPWYARHLKLAWAIIIACSLAGSYGGALTADALYGTSLHLWRSASGAQTGLAAGGSLLGTAAGIAIVMAIGGRRAR
jgi:hypothetical protein